MRVVGIGDSITRGRSADVGGLISESYVQTVADACGWWADIYAEGGATSVAVSERLLPQVGDGYDLALVYVGANDVLTRGFDLSQLADSLGHIVEHLRPRARRVAVLTLYPALGKLPTLWAYGRRRKQRIAEANDIIRHCGAEVVEVGDVDGRLVRWGDGVHLTALGEMALAQRVVRQLGLPGDVDLPEPSVGLGYHRFYWRIRAKAMIRQPLARGAKVALRR